MCTLSIEFNLASGNDVMLMCATSAVTPVTAAVSKVSKIESNSRHETQRRLNINKEMYIININVPIQQFPKNAL